MSRLRNVKNNIRRYTWKRLVWSMVIVALSLGVISVGAKFVGISGFIFRGGLTLLIVRS